MLFAPIICNRFILLGVNFKDFRCNLIAIKLFCARLFANQDATVQPETMGSIHHGLMIVRLCCAEVNLKLLHINVRQLHGCK